jgi:hypothetical protein
VWMVIRWQVSAICVLYVLVSQIDHSSTTQIDKTLLATRHVSMMSSVLFGDEWILIAQSVFIRYYNSHLTPIMQMKTTNSVYLRRGEEEIHYF